MFLWWGGGVRGRDEGVKGIHSSRNSLHRQGCARSDGAPQRRMRGERHILPSYTGAIGARVSVIHGRE